MNQLSFCGVIKLIFCPFSLLLNFFTGGENVRRSSEVTRETDIERADKSRKKFGLSCFLPRHRNKKPSIYHHRVTDNGQWLTRLLHFASCFFFNCCLGCDFKSNLTIEDAIDRYTETKSSQSIMDTDVFSKLEDNVMLNVLMEALNYKIPHFFLKALPSGSLRERFGKYKPSTSILATDYDIMLVPDGVTVGIAEPTEYENVTLMDDPYDGDIDFVEGSFKKEDDSLSDSSSFILKTRTNMEQQRLYSSIPLSNLLDGEEDFFYDTETSLNETENKTAKDGDFLVPDNSSHQSCNSGDSFNEAENKTAEGDDFLVPDNSSQQSCNSGDSFNENTLIMASAAETERDDQRIFHQNVKVIECPDSEEDSILERISLKSVKSIQEITPREEKYWEESVFGVENEGYEGSMLGVNGEVTESPCVAIELNDGEFDFFNDIDIITNGRSSNEIEATREDESSGREDDTEDTDDDSDDNQASETPILFRAVTNTNEIPPGFLWLKLENDSLEKWNSLCFERIVQRGAEVIVEKYLSQLRVYELIRSSIGSELELGFYATQSYGEMKSIQIDVKRTGPALNILISGSERKYFFQKKKVELFDADFTFALHCQSLPKAAIERIEALWEFQWPGRKVLRKIKKLGCHIVPKASQQRLTVINKEQPTNSHLKSSSALEFRYSYSQAELLLADKVPRTYRKCFMTFKALIKFNINNKPDKRRHSQSWGEFHAIPTYVLKTILFQMLVKHGVKAYNEENIGECLLEMVKQLTVCIKEGFCAMFWDPNVNLLAFLKDESKMFILEMLSLMTRNGVDSLKDFLLDDWLELQRCIQMNCCECWMPDGDEDDIFIEDEPTPCCWQKKISCSYNDTSTWWGPMGDNEKLIGTY